MIVNVLSLRPTCPWIFTNRGFCCCNDRSCVFRATYSPYFSVIQIQAGRVCYICFCFPSFFSVYDLFSCLCRRYSLVSHIVPNLHRLTDARKIIYEKHYYICICFLFCIFREAVRRRFITSAWCTTCFPATAASSGVTALTFLAFLLPPSFSCPQWLNCVKFFLRRPLSPHQPQQIDPARTRN